jgi:hypothetical protein
VTEPDAEGVGGGPTPDTDRSARGAGGADGESAPDAGRSEHDGGHDESASAPDTVGRDGRRLVLKLYVALVGVAATAGFLTGAVVDGLEAPRFLFVIPFPPTPLGFAAYGGLTLALVLGVPLGLVVYVSGRIDDA